MQLRRLAVEFGLATIAGLFLGLIGPFGSFGNGPRLVLIAYWVGMVWLGFAVFGLGVRPILRRLGRGPRGMATTLAYTLAACAPFTFASWHVAHAIWPRLHDVAYLTPRVWYLQSLILAAPQLALFALRWRRGRPAQVGDPAPAPGLLGAAPGDVLCLQMEDHYVRVHTAQGSRLVLATFAQALAAVAATAGVRVHRSWWVAHRAVTGAVADGRNLRLILVNGVCAPVARSAVARVREAGWLTAPIQETPETA